MFTQTGTTANLLFAFFYSFDSIPLSDDTRRHWTPSCSYLYPFWCFLNEARMAEWSKAVVSGTILFGGVGSNPTPCILFSLHTLIHLRLMQTLHCSYMNPIWHTPTRDSVAEWSKAVDLKSISLWERRFEPCHCRFTLCDDFTLTDIHLIYPNPTA